MFHSGFSVNFPSKFKKFDQTNFLELRLRFFSSNGIEIFDNFQKETFVEYFKTARVKREPDFRGKFKFIYALFHFDRCRLHIAANVPNKKKLRSIEVLNFLKSKTIYHCRCGKPTHVISTGVKTGSILL